MLWKCAYGRIGVIDREQPHLGTDPYALFGLKNSGNVVPRCAFCSEAEDASSLVVDGYPEFGGVPSQPGQPDMMPIHRTDHVAPAIVRPQDDRSVLHASDD